MTLEDILRLPDRDISKAVVICGKNPLAVVVRQNIQAVIRSNDPVLRARQEEKMTRNLLNAGVRL